MTDAYVQSGYETSSTRDRRISTGLSTLIIVYIRDGGNYPYDGNWFPVGAIQSLTVNETNALKRIGETRSPRTIEIIPQGQDIINLSVRRLVFDNLRLLHALGRGYSHIRSQRIPFDIVVFDKSHCFKNQFPLITVYHRCWLSTHSVEYKSDSYIISESATLEAEYVEDVYPVSSLYNEIALALNIDPIEVDYDQAVSDGALVNIPPAEQKIWTPTPPVASTQNTEETSTNKYVGGNKARFKTTGLFNY